MKGERKIRGKLRERRKIGNLIIKGRARKGEEEQKLGKRKTKGKMEERGKREELVWVKREVRGKEKETTGNWAK